MIFCLSNCIKLTKNINRTLWSDTIQLDEFKVHFYTFLSPANEVCEGYVFTGVCLSTGGGVSVSVQGGGLHPGGLCPGGSLSWGVSVQGVSVQGALSRGALCPAGSLSGRVSVWGVSVTENPLYSNERSVCILLECILVNFLSILIVHLSTGAMTNTRSPGIQESTYWTNTNTTSNFNHTEENQTDILIGPDGNQSNSVYAVIAQGEMYSDLVIIPMGVFVNFLSIAIFVKSRMAWTSVGLHLMYLAITDNIVLVSGFIGSSKFWHMFINIPDLWSSNIITCSGTYLSINLGFTWSGALLASTTVERFLAIAVPLKVKCWNIYHKSKILMGIYFILSLMLCSYGVQCYELTSMDGTNVCTPSSKY